MNATKNWFPDLPPEIIDKIFVECLPPTQFQTVHPKHAPLLLTHVCSFWRTFALDCPNLWREFPLEIKNGKDHRKSEKMLQQIALWHSATKGPRLTLSLHLENQSPAQRGSLWSKQIQAALFDHVESVHKLRLFIVKVDDGIPLFRLLGQRFCNLEYLHLQVFYFDKTLECMQHISAAPNLRRLQLAVTMGDIMPLPRFQQLTHLFLLDYSFPTPFHVILQTFPALERLSMLIEDRRPTLRWDGPMIVMDHLTYLSLTFGLCPSGPSLFKQISFPVLNCLQMATSKLVSLPLFSWATHDDIHQAYLLSQLHLLHTLVLTDQSISGDDLLDLLHSTPLLSKLFVHSDLKTYNTFFDGLTYRPRADRKLIPKLEEFGIYINTTSALEDDDGFEEEIVGFNDAMLCMIQSRCPSHDVLLRSTCKTAQISSMCRQRGPRSSHPPELGQS